ncbi:hypothetical protein FQN50_007584 [Emmonsiellopsis sp. PD_5]|nr:hypothetical protein FQN50_007584 [Emmonsiellopsis sp. PD_5]
MDFVDISHYRNTVSVGPGATWGKVYDTLEKYDLTVAGGRVGSVGVAGLILGGGMSHFPNHWGLACDNVKNFEVALADTSVVQANETQNPDLFKALKGGGANFGIITKIDLYTSPEFKIWYTENIYSPDDAEKVIKACVEVQKAMEFDDRIGYNLFLGADAVAVSLVYRGWTNPPPIFKVFDDITPVNTPVPPKNMTQASLARALDHGGNINCETGALTIKVDADFYMEVYRLLQEVERGTSGEHTFICAIQPIGSAAVHKGKERGGNSLNLSEENQAWLGIRAEWSDESDRETEQRKICRFMESVESKAKEHGVFLNFQSMNDASHRQSPLESYGSESLSALRQASIKFDPMGLFQRLQNSGFLLRNTNDE